MNTSVSRKTDHPRELLKNPLTRLSTMAILVTGNWDGKIRIPFLPGTGDIYYFSDALKELRKATQNARDTLGGDEALKVFLDDEVPLDNNVTYKELTA